jgi:sec-independent protein translocase protein TatC
MSGEGTLVSHLIELRMRLLRMLAAWLIALLCLFPFAQDLYTLLADPLLRVLPGGAHMIATQVTTPFFVPLKVAMVAAFLVALPYVLYQTWAFVAPGLYSHEKRLIAPLVIASSLLFVCGMAFAYFVVFPAAFHFITAMAPQGVAVMTDIGNYLDFVLTLFVAFGLAFEVPVAVVLLARMGITSVAQLRAARPYVIVGAFIIGAIFTPPDVLSQILLAIPIWLLYEAGILCAAWGAKPAAGSPRESLPD